MAKTLDEIIEMARFEVPRTVAVAGADDLEVVKASVEARSEGLANPILVGDPQIIGKLLAGLGESAGDYLIEAAASAQECAGTAVRLVKEGRANLLMKGSINTSELMRAVINKETGIRTGALMSHVMLYQTDTYPKVLAVTDGGMLPAPDLEQKGHILENAARLFQTLGYGEINAACICGAEVFNPKIPAMVDAAALVSQKDRWEGLNMNVIGPVGLDLAISSQACRHKGYEAPGCGNADILLVPTYEVGNALGKGMTYFAGARNAGVIVGALCPIVLVSRADDAAAKLASIALGAVVSQKKEKK